MDAFSIGLLVVCLILLCVVAWLFLRRQKSSDTTASDEISRLQSLLNEKDEIISSLKTEQQDLTAQTETLIVQLKEKNLKELKSSAEKIAELEAEIAKALEGGTDEIVKKKLAEVDKLAKKIKGLEADLEEAEDEADSLKRKTKTLQNENSGLQEELENEIRKGKKLIEEIEEVKSRLEQVEKDFAIREEALDFVKEILTAERTSDESVQTLYKNVDGIVDYIRGEVRDSLVAIYGNQQAISETEILSWAIAKKKSWIQGKTSIAFVGEFSAGKTSIVNRILSQDDPNVPRLPVSTKATTAIPTYISGGVSTYYQFVTPGNELKGISEETFKRVNKDVLDQVKGVSSLIQYFVMTYKNPNLDKLSILDTPGFNSNDSEDAERTIGVINECDALFWVFDVNAGTVNRSSIKIIKDNLTKPLYVVINQIDTKSKSDVDSVENLIRKTLQDEGIKIESIIRFSKKEPLENIMGPILAIKHDNSREQYLEELLSMLSERVKELANKTKAALKKSNQIENKHKWLVDSFVRSINNLSDACAAVAEIPRPNSRWFGEDDYRISQADYSRFISLLERICKTHTAEIVSQYDDQIEAVSELQISWNEHSQAKFNQKRLEECLGTLQKKAKVLFTGGANVYKSHISGKKSSQEKNENKSTSANYSSTSDKQPVNKSVEDSYTVDEILNKFVTNRKVDKSDGYEKVEVIISWSKLLQFINNVLGFQVSKDVARHFISKYGLNSYIELFSVSYGIRELCSHCMFKNDIRNCAKGSLKEDKITDNDIYWDNLIAILNSKYGIQMKKWQLFSTATEKSVDLSKLIKRIQTRIPDTFKITPNIV